MAHSSNLVPKSKAGDGENCLANDAGSNSSCSFLMMSYLDEVEDKIEALRRQACSLIQERDSLLTILSDMKQECTQHPNPTNTGM